MTEKDAVKCKVVTSSNCWYLEVRAKLSHEFDEQLVNKLKNL